MPYINDDKGQREGLACRDLVPNTAGELNYCITQLVHDYILRKGLSYAVANEIIGVLECAKLEVYRMVIAPYEDGKKNHNGSVSELDA